MYRAIGLLAGVVAFIVVGGAVSAFMGSGFFITAIPGGVAAYFAWKYFVKKDDEEVQALLNPPAQVWPVSLPIAWGCIRDVLDSTGVKSPQAGIQTWRIQREDDSRGIIQAQLNFSEQVAGPNGQSMLVPRAIAVTVTLEPEESATKVTFSFSVYSQMGMHTVKTILKESYEAFSFALKANLEGKNG